MPRRVIYIKNPKEGSHFRTVGDGGGGGGSNIITFPVNTPQPGQGVFIAGYTDAFGNPLFTDPTGGAWGSSAWNNPPPPLSESVTWVTYPFVNPAGGGIAEVEYPNYNLLTYEEFYALRYAEGTIWTAWYDIFRGISPQTGEWQPPLGTPGQMTLGSSLYFAGFIHTGGRVPGNLQYGGTGTPLPSGYTTRPHDPLYQSYVSRTKQKRVRGRKARK